MTVISSSAVYGLLFLAKCQRLFFEVASQSFISPTDLMICLRGSGMTLPTVVTFGTT